MTENEMKSGDFLKDVEITICIRSGHTDLVILSKLLQVVKTSVASAIDTEIVMAEMEQKVKITPEGKLCTSICKLYVD